MDAIERADLADLADQVYQRLRDDILRGRFSNDERLHLGRLAERFGVSPTPVKTAIARLTSEGLIAQGSRGGAFVTSLTEADIDELAEVRAMIEHYAADRAIALSRDEEIDRLETLARSLLTRIREDGTVDYDGFADDDMTFHTILIGIAGNHHLSRLYASLHVYSVVRRAHYLEHGLGFSAQRPLTPYVHVHDEHMAIVAALRARDRDALQVALHAHLEVVRDFAKRVLATAETLDTARP